MYSKQKPPQQRANQHDPNEKYRRDGYIGRLHGKTVKIMLCTGEELEGTLGTNNYNRYFVMLTSKDRNLLVIQKGSIVYIKEQK